jgi:hypothetical protein
MGDYNRVSRECKFEDLGQDIVVAVNAHIEKYNLGNILSDALICLEIKSDKTSKGLFAPPGPKFTQIGIILTTRWFVQTIKIDKKPLIARSARLEDITVSDYEKNQFFKQFPDNGVEVTGRFTDASESSTSFVGLGKDLAGERIKELIFKAVQDAKL